MTKVQHRTRIIIVDDHPLMRCGFRALISDEPDLEVCEEASNAEEALQLIERDQLDLAVVDIALDGQNGLELIKRIKARDSRIKVLVVSMYEASLFAERCLRAGAMGYVNKEEATDTVVEAIRRILQGHVYLNAETTDQLLLGVAKGRDPTRVSSVETLTDRELEVFALLGRGLSTREIANKLHLSVKTIETHRENIKSKMRLANSHELTRSAVQWVLENG